MQCDEQTQGRMFSMIASWQQSSLSQKQYCEQNNIRYAVFHYWYKRYKQRQTPQPPDAGFVPLNIHPAPSFNSCPAQIEILLADGTRVLFHQAVSSAYLKALIR